MQNRRNFLKQASLMLAGGLVAPQGEIEQIIHSSKYKARLAEYNKNKTLAEKNLEQKNYASAKVYFQKALTLSPADKESIRERIVRLSPPPGGGAEVR